jgi:hypothetical protein
MAAIGQNGRPASPGATVGSLFLLVPGWRPRPQGGSRRLLATIIVPSPSTNRAVGVQPGQVLRPGRTRRGLVRAGERGSAALARPGPLWLAVEAKGRLGVVRVEPDVDATVAIPRSGSVRVVVRTLTGAPAEPFAGIELRIEPLDAPDAFGLSFMPQLRPIAQHDGSILTPQLAPGRYRLTITPSSSASSRGGGASQRSGLRPRRSPSGRARPSRRRSCSRSPSDLTLLARAAPPPLGRPGGDRARATPMLIEVPGPVDACPDETAGASPDERRGRTEALRNGIQSGGA